MRTKERALLLLLLVAGVVAVEIGALHHPHSPAAAPASSTSTVAPRGPAVVGIDWEPQQPTAPLYARCRTAGGHEFLVVVSSAAADQLSQGQTCPTGRHLPTSNLGTYAELIRSLPYHGGDPRSVCGAWEAANATWAKEMAAEQAKCEAQHGGGQR